MFNFINYSHFIPVRGCVGGVLNAQLCLGFYNAVKMALYRAQQLDNLLPFLKLNGGLVQLQIHNIDFKW